MATNKDYAAFDREHLLAMVLEYEHALEHAVEDHTTLGPVCTDCQALCQSALDGRNATDFLDIAREIINDKP